jgi:hypothetical protein
MGRATTDARGSSARAILEQAGRETVDTPSTRIIIGVNNRSRHKASTRQHTDSRGESMSTKTALLAALAAAMLTGMSARAQQAVTPENAMLPEMPSRVSRYGFGFTIAIGPMILFGSAFGLGRNICDRSFETSVTYRLRAESTWI